jgi:hypothetical protein
VKKQLCIQISENFCSFASLSAGNLEIIKSIVFTEKKDFQFKESLNALVQDLKNNLNFDDFDDITVSWISQNALLIPSSIFRPNEMESIFSTCFTKKISSNELDFNRLMEHSLAIIYEIPLWVKSFFIIKFPRVVIQHEYAHLVRGMMKKSAQLTIQLATYPNLMHLGIVNKGELILCNSYEISHPNDIIYYLSFALQQLNLLESKGKINCCIHDLSFKEEEFSDSTKISSFLKDNLQKMSVFREFQLTFDNKQTIQNQEFCV